MTTFALRKRFATTGQGATAGRAGTIALGVVALIVLRAAPGSDVATLTAGALLQSLTRNPLASPDLLGVTGGAQLGLLAAMLVPALAGVALVLATDSAVLAAGLDATLSTGVAIALVGTPLMLAMIRRGAAWSGVLHAQPERAAGGGATRLVGRLERLEGLGWPLRGALFAASAAVVVAIVFAGVSAGPEWVTPARWWAALAGHDPVARMLIDLRMPRLLCALFAGALLAASGVAMQSVVRNPLAGPEVLGVTQGAGLVTLFALSTWPLAGQLTLAAAALTGGALSLAITLALNHRHRYAPLAVALTGIAIGALWTTLAQWLITQESVQPARFVVWLVGGTYGRSWGEVAMLLPWCALAVPVFAWLARPLDMLALGLMAPHVATMLSARRHRARLYVAAACGAVLLGAADLAARTLVAPREVPAGVLTALIGAPYLLRLLILEGRRAPHAFLGILARTARRSDYRSFT